MLNFMLLHRPNCVCEQMHNQLPALYEKMHAMKVVATVVTIYHERRLRGQQRPRVVGARLNCIAPARSEERIDEIVIVEVGLFDPVLIETDPSQFQEKQSGCAADPSPSVRLIAVAEPCCTLLGGAEGEIGHCLGVCIRGNVNLFSEPLPGGGRHIKGSSERHLTQRVAHWACPETTSAGAAHAAKGALQAPRATIHNDTIPCSHVDRGEGACKHARIGGPIERYMYVRCHHALHRESHREAHRAWRAVG